MPWSCSIRSTGARGCYTRLLHTTAALTGANIQYDITTAVVSSDNAPVLVLHPPTQTQNGRKSVDNFMLSPGNELLVSFYEVPLPSLLSPGTDKGLFLHNRSPQGALTVDITVI